MDIVANGIIALKPGLSDFKPIRTRDKGYNPFGLTKVKFYIDVLIIIPLF